MLLEKVRYDRLNARQKENFNFAKIAGHLADYGFNCLKLSDDWQGADFIAIHIDGEQFLKVQLKSRATLAEKYRGKSIHIAFISGSDVYLYPHDEAIEAVLPSIGHTVSWRKDGMYSWPSVPQFARAYRI